MAKKPTQYTKAGQKMYSFYEGSGFEAQLPKWVVEQMVEQALNKFGFDVATAAAQKQELNLYNERIDFLIEQELKHYQNVKTSAEELSIALIKGRQLINDPMGYAMDKAKNKIRKEFQLSNSFGGLLNKDIATKFAGQQVLETTINIVENVADSAINRYTTLQEDYLTAQTYSNVKSTISRAKQLGGSIVSGVVSGMATAGPSGAVIGAISSAVNYGASQYLEYQKRMSSYYQQLNATNFQTNYSASRLGLVNNGRGTEN